MTTTKPLIASVIVLCCAPAGADEVYRCEQDGAVTYTDRPCAKDAQPRALPEAIVIRPPAQSERELARQHDARIRRDKAARDRGDAEWVKAHQARKSYRDEVRAAIIERRAIKGMTADEVRRALGEPDGVTRSESHGSVREKWTYTGDGATRTVNFKNGEVSSVSSGRRKK